MNIIPIIESVPRVPAYASGPSGTGFNLHFREKSPKDESLKDRSSGFILYKELIA